MKETGAVWQTDRLQSANSFTARTQQLGLGVIHQVSPPEMSVMVSHHAGKNCVHTIEISAEGESCLQTGSAPDMVFSVSVDYLTWFSDTCSYFPSLTVTVRLTSPQTSSPQTWWSRWSVTWRRPSDSTSPTWQSTPPWETTTTGRRYRCSRRKDDENRTKIQKCLIFDTQQISLIHLGGWVKFCAGTNEYAWI